MGKITRVAIGGLAALLLTGTTGAVAADPPLVSTLAADAQSLSGNQGADIYGVGGGKTNYFGIVQTFDLSAHEGPDGDFGHVSVTFYNPLGEVVVGYRADVTCVKIHTLGSTAYDRGWISGVIKNVTPVPNMLALDVGDAVDFGIKDGGNPSSTTPVDDFYAPNIQAAGSCKTLFYTGDLNNVTQGNVNIKGP
jgi:hypothetical protein